MVSQALVKRQKRKKKTNEKTCTINKNIMLSLHQTKFIVNPLEKTQINLMVGKAPQQKQHFKWDRFQLRGRKISELKKKKKGKLEKGVLRLAWSPRDVYHGGVKHYFNLLFILRFLFYLLETEGEAGSMQDSIPRLQGHALG